MPNHSDIQGQNIKIIFEIYGRKLAKGIFFEKMQPTFSNFLENLIMLDASNFRAIVGSTIQGFSNLLNFAIGVPRPRRLIT